MALERMTVGKDLTNAGVMFLRAVAEAASSFSKACLAVPSALIEFKETQKAQRAFYLAKRAEASALAAIAMDERQYIHTTENIRTRGQKAKVQLEFEMQNLCDHNGIERPQLQPKEPREHGRNRPKGKDSRPMRPPSPPLKASIGEQLTHKDHEPGADNPEVVA